MRFTPTKKISELEALNSATLDTTFVVGISGSTTYKISINQLTSSLDTTFASDLVTTALSNSLDTKLNTSSFNESSASFNNRINSISSSVSTGTSGTSGLNGTSGTSGTHGTSGITVNYRGTSTDTIDFSSINLNTNQSLTTSVGLSYTIAQHLIIAHSLTEHFHGDVVSYDSVTGALVVNVTEVSILSGVFSSWTTNLDGAAGGNGTSGVDGTSGTTGIDGTSGIDGLNGTSGIDGLNGTSGIDGLNGTSGIDGLNGTSGISGTSGTDGTSGGSGTSGISGTSGTDGVAGTSGTSGFSIDSASYATTGSNSFSGSQFISGSLIPAVGVGTFTSSFSLGSPTNAWKDIYVSHGSIIFVDAVTQATSSFTIAANQEVQYSNGITASYYEGDARYLDNFSSTTNWNYNQEYQIKKTEQLTFSGDYILDNTYLEIEGSQTASIGEWTEQFFTNGPTGSITRNSNNQYTLIGPIGDTNGGNGLQLKRLFDTPTTMSVYYTWSGDGTGSDRPYYVVDTQDPVEPDNSTRLTDPYATSESGTWTINVPSGSWVAIGVWTDNINATSGSLQITLPYLPNEDISQYSPNKYFKREGSIFIGGNLLVKDSTIVNNGKISVGGEVILIGNSEITGTGIII